MALFDKNLAVRNESIHKQGNTSILIKHVFGELEKAGIETELMELAGMKVQGCTACYKCFDRKHGLVAEKVRKIQNNL